MSVCDGLPKGAGRTKSKATELGGGDPRGPQPSYTPLEMGAQNAFLAIFLEISMEISRGMPVGICQLFDENWPFLEVRLV